MNTESAAPETKSRTHASARARATRRRAVAIAALGAVVSASLASSAAAAPKPIAFSGTLQGISVDVGTNPGTGDTFRTVGGTFTAATGLKRGVYSAAFTLGAMSFPVPVIVQWEVTGTLTLRTNGGTFTAVAIPGTSYASTGTNPGSAFQRRFHVELQVVSGTGRFKKTTGTLQIDSVASMCGWPPGSPPEPLCPDVPFGSDPVPDWTHTGTVTGALVRRVGPSSP